MEIRCLATSQRGRTWPGAVLDVQRMRIRGRLGLGLGGGFEEPLGALETLSGGGPWLLPLVMVDMFARVWRLKSMESVTVNSWT